MNLPTNPSASLAARNPHLFTRQPSSNGGVDREAELHEDIEKYCRERRWPSVHSRMDMPTTTAKGTPDFVIYLPKGIILTIEAKTKTGKLSPEQLGFMVLIGNLGHKYHVVRSMAEFETLVNEVMK